MGILKPVDIPNNAMRIFNLTPETDLSACRRNIFVVITISILIFSVYSNTLDASWHFDNKPNILDNKPLHVTELNLKNIKNTFFAHLTGNAKLYRPVVCLSFALNYYFGQTKVFGYHLVNLVIHFVSAVFLFLFIYHTLNLPILKESYGHHAYFIAFFSTVFWAINPVQIQAVTYIVQRMASMAGLFYIASMYFFLKGRTSTQRSPRLLYYSLTFTCSILALGSKENAVMIPITLLLVELFLIQGITKSTLTKYAFLALIAVLTGVAATLLLKGPSVLNPENIISAYAERGFTLTERLLTQPRIVLFYISLLLYPMPQRLCISHDISLSKGLFDPPTTIIAILAILILVGLSIFKAKKCPLLCFCILFFFLNHAVESTFIGLELAFEHRNYIPSMFFFLPISILTIKVIDFFSYKRALQVFIIGFIILVAIGFGHSAYMRNFAWKTEEALWLDAVEKSPNLARAHHNLGRCYGDMGLKYMALKEYKEALKLPEGLNRNAHYLTHYNMGLIYQSFQANDLATRHFHEALKKEHRHSPTYTCLGVLDLEQGKNKSALNYFVKALSYDIGSLKARNYVGLAPLKLGKIDSAIHQFQKVLKTDPKNLYALTHLGAAYKKKGDFNKALRCFRQALYIEPEYVTSALHLIETYSRMGKDKAAQSATKTLIDRFSESKVNLLIKDRILQTDPLLAQANPDIILPIFEKILTKRSDQYSCQAKEIRAIAKKKLSK